MKIRAIALNTFREAIRNKILYSVVVFAAVLVIMSALFGTVTIGNTAKVIKDFGLFSISFFGAVITIICGVNLLNKELKQKTVYNILSKPVSRWQFVLGKHLGLSLTSCFLIALMTVGFVGFAALFDGKIDWLLFQAALLIMLEMIVVAAVAIFFSSLVVTTTLTGIFTLATYIAGRSIFYFQHFLNEKGDNYNVALANVIRIFDWIVPDLHVFNVSNSIVYGQAITGHHLMMATIYCASYSLIALILAALIFAKRELT